MSDPFAILFGVVLGVGSCATLAWAAKLRLENIRLIALLEEARTDAKHAVKLAAIAEQNLETAKATFEHQLTRKVQAYFNDAQVETLCETLAHELTKRLFRPVADLIHKERDNEHHS